MTGKTQLEAVAVLRNIEVNSIVDIVVSRQTDEENHESTEVLTISSPSLASVITNNESATKVKETAKSVTLESLNKAPPPLDNSQEVTVFAHLSDINSPKYGMTLKPISMHGSDLGLFIHKSTSKENKFPLPNNARLVEVGGTSLLGISNNKALQFVTKAMKKDAANPGSISVKISGNGIPSPATTESSGNSNTLLHPISCVDGKMYTMNEAGNLGSGKTGKYEKGNDFLHSTPTDAHKEPNPSPHPSNGSQCIESSESVDPIDTNDECAEDLDVTLVVFNREGFGRQSMSEKRKGHIDPRGTDVYQKIRMNKDFSYASWDPRKSAFHKSEGSKHSDLFRTVAAKKCRSLENLHVDENGEQMAPLDELSDIAKDPFHGNMVTSDASSYELETVDEQFAEYDNTDGRVGGYEITDVKVKNVNESRKSERKKSDHDSLVGLIKKSIDRIKFGRPKKIYDLKMQQKIPPENANESESDRRRVGKTSFGYPSQEAGNLSKISHDFLAKVCSESRVNAKDERHSQFTLPGKFQMNKKSSEQIEQLRREYQQKHEDRKKRYPVDDMEERRIQEYERQRSRLTNQDAPQPSVQRVGQYSSAEQELVEFCESANPGYSHGKSYQPCPRTANAVPYRQCQNTNSRDRFFDSTVYFDGANYHTSSLPNRNSKKRSTKDQLLLDPYVATAPSNYHEIRSKRDYPTSKSVFYQKLPTSVEHSRQTSVPLVSENSNRAGPDETRRKSHSGVQPLYICNYQGQYRAPTNELHNRFEGLISRSAQV